MMIRMRHQLLFEMLCHPIYNIGILGMHHSGDAKFASGIHDIENLIVSKPHGLVCHIQLHAGDSILIDHPWKFFFDDLWGRIGDDDVKSVVAVGLAIGKLVVIFDDRDNALVLLHLRSKSDHRCRPSSYRTARASIIGISDIVFEIRNDSIRND